MNSNTNIRQGLILGAVVFALLSMPACGWMRSKTGYELSPEARPLEIPPEMNAPRSDLGLQVPQVASSPQGASGSQAVAPSQAFTLADSAAGAYQRVGIALDRIEGVSINERSQLLTVYTVSYEGETFMIRISPEGENARVAAASTEGRELSSGAAAKLLGLLRQRLG